MKKDDHSFQHYKNYVGSLCGEYVAGWVVDQIATDLVRLEIKSRRDIKLQREHDVWKERALRAEEHLLALQNQEEDKNV